MMNPNVIHSQTGKAVPLDTITNVGEIAANPANIASLCICIAELVKERQLWLEPNKEMVQAGLAEVQQVFDDWCTKDNIEGFSPIEPEDLTDAMASDMAVFVLQAMAGKRNG